MQALEQTSKKSEISARATKKQNPWRVIATKMRKRRFAEFKARISSLPRPLRILDVGGTQEFWEEMEFVKDDVEVVIYNLSSIEVSYPSLISIAGDARNMQEFANQEFELVFSNSVIEHVGTYEQQHNMAEEVQRVGKRYCVQTPNRFFPIEPHVLLPFFQFLPFELKVFILSHFKTLWGWKLSNRQEAVEYVNEIRLLTQSELKSLFPGAQIHKERFLGLTKSFIVYKGWEL